MDLLGRYAQEEPPFLITELSDDYAVRPLRPRARRSRPWRTKPFDAKEAWLDDRQRPLAQWRPSSLLYELHEQAGPAEEDQEDPGVRLAQARRVLDQMETLGVEGERILRSNFVRDIAQAIVTIVTLPMLIGASRLSGEVELPESPQRLSGWSTLLLGHERTPKDWLCLGHELGMDWAQEQAFNVFANVGRIAVWLSRLPLDDLMAWRCPSTVEFGSTSPVILPEPDRRDVWLHDRFTQTYLDGWCVESLTLEWQYAHGQCSAPCVAEVMKTRHINENDLAKAIAARVASVDGDEKRSHRSMTPGMFVEKAVVHLRSGRRSTAAGIFDACRIAVPDDPEAHNNYAFCILPEDPAAALHELDLAAELGLRYEPINVANRMLALYRLGRSATALEVAERAAADERFGRRPWHGYLWAFDSPADDPKLLSVTDAYRYVCDLAVHISVEASDQSNARLWERRRQALGSDPG